MAAEIERQEKRHYRTGNQTSRPIKAYLNHEEESMRRDRDYAVIKDKYYDPEAYEDPDLYFKRYSRLSNH